MTQKLLIVDDEAAILRTLKRLFRKSNYELLTAKSAEEGFQLCREHSPQVILSDFLLPGMNGSELLQKTAELVPAPVGILLSGQADLNLVLDALNSGQVFKFITKPWQDDELLEQVSRAFDLYSSQVMPPFNPGPGQCVMAVNATGALLEACDSGTCQLLALLETPVGERLTACVDGLTEEKLDYLIHYPGNSLTLADDFGEPLYRLCSRVRSSGVHEVLITHLREYVDRTGTSTHTIHSQSQMLALIKQHLLAADAASMVVCLEVARFKELNRQLGFMASSRLLSVLGEHIGRHLPENAAFGVLGAEQFAILLPLPEAEGLEHLKRLLDHFAEPIPLFDRKVMIPLYAGYSFAAKGDASIDAESLLQRATSAVHSLVQSGQTGQVHCYDARFDEDIANRDRVENALFGALERNEFSLVYQPKVSLESGRIVGAEALIRWKSRELGIISPAIFIPMAEQNGLIHIIGDWVLAAACAQVRVWRLQDIPTVPISVNLAAPQLRNDSLIKRITGILNEAGSSPSDLKIELTETSLIQDVVASSERIEQLRSLGVGIALDDFGTGYSSLSYLNRLPIDILKIDKCFIDEISPDNERGRLVKHIINMSHDMGYEVIAEGVESTYQLDVLRQYGCDIVQGYVYSPPVSADTLREMLKQQPFRT